MNNTVQLTLLQALIGTLIGALIIFCTRLLPFALFSKKDPPFVIKFIEKFIPSMIMAILVVYCLKDIQFMENPYGVPYYLGLLFTIVFHLWFKNSMISIFGGTIIFMVLSRLL